MEFVEKEHPGAAAWLTCMKRGCRRSGPVPIPMIGVPFFILPLRDMFVHMFPGQELVSTGIPVSSYANYAATPEGQKKVKASSATAFVQQGGACFVPAGYITSMVYFKDVPTKEKKGALADTASALLLPVPLKKQLSGMLFWPHESLRCLERNGDQG